MVDTMASLRTISAGVAFFLGPILGGLIKYYLGYTVLMFVIAVLFLICGAVELAETIKSHQEQHAYKPVKGNDEIDEDQRVLIPEKDDDK